MQDSKLLVAGTISGANNAITGQSLVGNAGTAQLGAFSVDANPAANQGVDWGEGAPIYLKWLITTTLVGCTGLTINVVSDSNANLTTTPVVLASANAPALTAGTFGYLVVPPSIGSMGQEFYGASFTPTGANCTAGAIVAEFTNVVDDPRKFAKSGFAIV